MIASEIGKRVRRSGDNIGHETGRSGLFYVDTGRLGQIGLITILVQCRSTEMFSIFWDNFIRFILLLTSTVECNNVKQKMICYMQEDDDDEDIDVESFDPDSDTILSVFKEITAELMKEGMTFSFLHQTDKQNYTEMLIRPLNEPIYCAKTRIWGFEERC